MRRVVAGKEDDYRWLIEAGLPNFQGYGVIGDGISMPPPRPLVTRGNIIVVTADVSVPAIAGLGYWSTELMPFYDAAGLSPILQFFLPLGIAVFGGAEQTGVAPPSGGVNLRYMLTASSPPSSSSEYTLWQSVNILATLTPPRFAAFSSNPAHSNAQFIPHPVGVNSYNIATSAPSTQLLFGVSNQHATNPSVEGYVRTVLWGVEA